MVISHSISLYPSLTKPRVLSFLTFCKGHMLSLTWKNTCKSSCVAGRTPAGRRNSLIKSCPVQWKYNASQICNFIFLSDHTKKKGQRRQVKLHLIIYFTQCVHMIIFVMCIQNEDCSEGFCVAFSFKSVRPSVLCLLHLSTCHISGLTWWRICFTASWVSLEINCCYFWHIYIFQGNNPSGFQFFCQLLKFNILLHIRNFPLDD